MSDFYLTNTGVQFFQGTMPSLIDAINNHAQEMARLTDAVKNILQPADKNDMKKKADDWRNFDQFDKSTWPAAGEPVWVMTESGCVSILTLRHRHSFSDDEWAWYATPYETMVNDRVSYVIKWKTCPAPDYYSDKKSWTVFDPNDRKTWPEDELKVWVYTKSGQTALGCMSEKSDTHSMWLYTPTSDRNAAMQQAWPPEEVTAWKSVKNMEQHMKLSSSKFPLDLRPYTTYSLPFMSGNPKLEEMFIYTISDEQGVIIQLKDIFSRNDLVMFDGFGNEYDRFKIWNDTNMTPWRESGHLMLFNSEMKETVHVSWDGSNPCRDDFVKCRDKLLRCIAMAIPGHPAL